MKKITLAIVAIVTAFLLIGGTATAASLITSKNIKDGTILVKDLNPNTVKSLKGKNGLAGKNGISVVGATGATGAPGLQGPAGVNGANGAVGPQGASGLEGAYYAIAKYDVGDTNSGAIATVACSNVTDVAISGGVQIVDPSKNTPVASSFPGRMDWATNSPKADRLDGWIVQFGGNAGAVSDKAPEKETIWALCVPGATIPVVTTYTQSE